MIDDNLQTAATRFDVEAIHEVRLGIKHLKAHLQFISALRPERFNFQNDFLVFRRLFKLAAVLRDLQVQQQLARRYAKDLSLNIAAYQKHLKERELRTRETFVDGMVQYREASLKGLLKKVKENTLFTKTELAHKGQKLILKKLQRVKKLLSGIEYPAQLHEVRTELKEIHYIVDFLKFCRIDMPDQYTNKRIKKLEGKLGNWHDRVVLLQFIENFVSSNFSEGKVPAPYTILLEQVRLELRQLETKVREPLYKLLKRSKKELAFY